MDAKNNPQRKPCVAIVGQYQIGKSTLVNCLLGGCYAVRGEGCVTTRYNTRYVFGEMPEIRVVTTRKELSIGDLSPESVQKCVSDIVDGSELKIMVYSPFLESVDIMDTPGWGANKTDNETATTAVQSVDAYVYVLQKAIDQTSDLPYLREIAKQNKPIFIVLNCFNECDPTSKQAKALAKEVESKLESESLSDNCYAVKGGCHVLPINLLWAEYALRCACVEELPKIDRKVKSFLDDGDDDRGRLLSHSGILPLRNAIVRKLLMLSRLPGASQLSLMDRAADIIHGELVKLFRR